MTRILLIRRVAPFALLLAVQTQAQPASGPAADTARNEAELGLGGPGRASELPSSNLSDIAGAASRVLLTAAGKEKAASLQLVGCLGSSCTVNAARGGFYRTTFSFTFNTPLDDNRFQSLDRLTNGQSLDFRLANTVERPEPDAELAALRAKAEAACARAHPVTSPASSNSAPVLLPKCGTEIDPYSAAFLTEPGEYQRFQQLRDASLNTNWRNYGVEGSIAFRKYDYFDLAARDLADPARFAARDARRTDWRVAAFYSLIPTDLPLRTVVTFRGGYKRSSEAAKSATNCPNVPGAAVLRCQTGAFDLPTTTSTVPLTVELRIWGDGGLPTANPLIRRWAIQPGLTVDAKSGDVEAELPIFLVPDDKGRLTGGIRLGYSTRNDFVAGIFVGSAFTID